MTIGDFYGQPWHGGFNPVPDVEWMTSLAQRWVDFPAEADPRPVVLVAEPEHNPGYISSQAKTDWMQRHGSPYAGGSSQEQEPAPYRTDRGVQLLPTIRHDVVGALGPILIANLKAVPVWSPPQRPPDEHWYGGVDVFPDPDDPLVVTWQFAGSPEVYTDYPDAAVLETPAALVVVPRPVERPGTDSRLDYGQTRHVSLRLAGPVAGRVLLDVYGRVAVLHVEGRPPTTAH